jgi:hypothetical protein
MISSKKKAKEGQKTPKTAQNRYILAPELGGRLRQTNRFAKECRIQAKKSPKDPIFTRFFRPFGPNFLPLRDNS